MGLRNSLPFTKVGIHMALDPLYLNIPEVALKDNTFYELLTITDTLRVGRAREIKMQDYFEYQIVRENIDALDIYRFVTIDTKNKDLPGFVENLLIQRFFEFNG